MATWCWSAETLFWQVLFDHNMESNIKDAQMYAVTKVGLLAQAKFVIILTHHTLSV